MHFLKNALNLVHFLIATTTLEGDKDDCCVMLYCTHAYATWRHLIAGQLRLFRTTLTVHNFSFDAQEVVHFRSRAIATCCRRLQSRNFFVVHVSHESFYRIELKNRNVLDNL